MSRRWWRRRSYAAAAADDDTAGEELRSYVVAVEVAADNRAESPPVPARVTAELIKADAAGIPNYSKGDKDDPCCDTYSLVMKCLENTKNDFKKCKTLIDKYEECSNPPKEPRLCPAHELAFEKCLQKNVGEIKVCQFWMDMMSKCLRRNKQWV
ncbi:uncharacterized protein [Oryza sativa Japonica Group]|uniref:Os07g0189500 protein n=3 Tax=Oryza TaxID=4527 RepID=A0A0P0X384_ORYSJ|nr:hypothetical protein OsJ_23390 [Oryza sativa Japonica Group]KAF2921764.1 hypothetical protein DAI22_07g058300 [Oryza sativa Japonica Group]BAC83922.1 hypothetical protein [Oryza sativa Japonica Group]BAD31856.1 hypothetical protein [Oryza sativa Japonica Group]BAT00406.1 Os07g0189500 [Oryza sativa Japonica Group]